MICRSIDYSKIASCYDNVREMDKDNIDKWISALVRYGKIEKESSVLEVGCGTGRFTIPLYQQTHARFTALDPSWDMLKIAKDKELSGSIAWIRGRAEKLPFIDSTFNCVFMVFTLQHIEDRTQALREIYRILRPGGKVVLGTASHGLFKKEVVSKYFPDLLTIDLTRFPPIPKLKIMLKVQSFNDIKSHYVEGEPAYLSKKEYVDWILQKPLSTFTLLAKDKLKEGLASFVRAEIDRKMRQHFVYYRCLYVVGTKP